MTKSEKQAFWQAHISGWKASGLSNDMGHILTILRPLIISFPCRNFLKFHRNDKPNQAKKIFKLAAYFRNNQ
ncbi:MAG TPA: hypothetical protein ENI99_01565 [Sedimenticola sp.]|nr:hypothetical protein [Sedimenticola sp.]